MEKIIKLIPVFQEKIWGGNRLNTEFGYEIPSKKTGECWAISALPQGDCLIANGEFKGHPLSQIYNSHRELFANDTHDKFPLLVKIIDAHDDLSVQVHPNDDYALKNEKQSGKTEAWIILGAENNTRVQLGHQALNKTQLREFVLAGKWQKLLSYRPLQLGEVIYVPTGTVHALCRGTLLLEIQQSSDVTYRLYDYDRVDEHGNHRDLHIEKALDVITVPYQAEPLRTIKPVTDYSSVATLIESRYFNIYQVNVQGKYAYPNSKGLYFLLSVIAGEGTIDGLAVHKGDHLIATSFSKTIKFDGHMTVIAVHS